MIKIDTPVAKEDQIKTYDIFQMNEKKTQDIDNIVSSQRINPNELQNLGIIGEGHGGFVYKYVFKTKKRLK